MSRCNNHATSNEIPDDSRIQQIYKLASRASRFLKRKLADNAEITIIIDEGDDSLHLMDGNEPRCEVCEANKLKTIAGEIMKKIAERN